ncbi:DNA-binding MarR family transcriptional regulator [Glutamicibacter mysorens]|uniref:DNA-binding MarR family transcriptional regulator n=1 Tax=Glutamicibacter mysorens TaxID=257984 RepID=A0ABX4N1M7_9MICC|nr:MarR family transcriptional regulator [Glutamicibacter mysorens]PJJ45710.1 DNA-binding MarR family transcriptional regulator [Glutamicibacter mysorens]
MLSQLNERQEIWRGLLYGQRSMMLRLSAELKRDFGLSAAQFEGMLTLVESPDNSMPATQLAQRLLYSSGSGSHLIARLEEMGHVTRDRDPMDARVVVVALTESGLELINSALEVHTASLAREFDDLIDDGDLSVLLAFARKLAAKEGVISQPFSAG